MVKHYTQPCTVCIYVWQHYASSYVSGNKSTEIKTSNHFERPFQLPLPGKNKKSHPVPFRKLLWKGSMLYSKSKSIVANSPRLILALIQHGTRAQVIKMNSPLLLAPNSPLQIVFLSFFVLFFCSYPSVPQLLSSCSVYVCVWKKKPCFPPHVNKLVPCGQRGGGVRSWFWKLPEKRSLFDNSCRQRCRITGRQLCTY